MNRLLKTYGSEVIARHIGHPLCGPGDGIYIYRQPGKAWRGIQTEFDRFHVDKTILLHNKQWKFKDYLLHVFLILMPVSIQQLS